MKFRQYGKHNTSLTLNKKSFFNENDKLVKDQERIANFYIKQPQRLECKNCCNNLKSFNDFNIGLIGYKICSHCSHLNAVHQDTDSFLDFVFTGVDGAGSDYAEIYREASSEQFNSRLTSIYIPKAEFLYTSISNDGLNPNRLRYLDFGSGSGYFVGALNRIGLKNVEGTDVNLAQVNFGNKMLGKKCLFAHDIKNTNKILREIKVDVVSLIGVLEGLKDPRGALDSIRKNEHVKYIYILVPLFSISVFMLMFSKNVYQRQLTGGHTHLYTKKSIDHILKEFDLEIVSEWWFGTDVVDMYRHFLVNIKRSNFSEDLMDSFNEMLLPLIDSLQLEIDKKHQSSEVHLLLKKK